jgi:hypothetical protein
MICRARDGNFQIPKANLKSKIPKSVNEKISAVGFFLWPFKKLKLAWDLGFDCWDFLLGKGQTAPSPLKPR